MRRTWKQPVAMLNERGEEVQRWASVGEAAYHLRLTTMTLGRYVKKGKELPNGCKLIHVEELKSEDQMNEVEKMPKKRDISYKFKNKNEPISAKMIREDMTLEEAERIEVKFAKANITLQRVSYELRYGRVGVTLCRKKEQNAWPMVGTYGCKCCAFFRGRVPTENFVLCAFKSYNSKELLKYGRKEV